MSHIGIGIAAGAMLLLAAAVPRASAQMTVEGTVEMMRVALCDPKPGACEGTLILELKGEASSPLTIKVVKGTQIAEGTTPVLLPDINRRSVRVTYVVEKGENIARAIQVSPSP